MLTLFSLFLSSLQLIPDKLLAENRAKNIPQLTANQMAVIYKLIWYQDGYEQPSEEDLKRIMIVSANLIFYRLENYLICYFSFCRIPQMKTKTNTMYILDI